MPSRLRVSNYLCFVIFPADDSQSVCDHGTPKRNYLSFKDLPHNLFSKEMETLVNFHRKLPRGH